MELQLRTSTEVIFFSKEGTMKDLGSILLVLKMDEEVMNSEQRWLLGLEVEQK